jgi:predicted acylesterase/phospholipase RssA
MYVRDAVSVAPGRRVAAACSVSGGSVTNAVIAHSGSLDGHDGGAFDRAAGELLRHATGPGSVLKHLSGLYYFGLLFPTLAAFILLAWFGLPHIPLAILCRAAGIVVITFMLIVALVLVLAAAERGFATWIRFRFQRLPSLRSPSVRRRSSQQYIDWMIEYYVRPGLVTFGIFLVLTVMLFGLADGVLAMPEWRHGFAVIAAALAAVGGCLYVWSRRGPLLEQKIDAVLRRVTKTTDLSDMPCAPHHILCATEIQHGETAYFAYDAITIPSLGRFTSEALPTARAVRASAAFPIAFPPVLLRGVLVRGVLRGGVWDVRDPRVPKRSNGLSNLVLVDGGVRDNLALDWFERGHAPTTDELVVVSGAPNRSSRSGFLALPGFSEVLAFIRISFLPYNTRERLRHRAAAKLLYAPAWNGKEAAAGAIAHIEDSPDDLPLQVLACSGELKRRELEREDLERKEHRLVDQLPRISHPSGIRMTAEEERQWKRQSQLKDALFRAGALPDYAKDQALAAGDLVHAAGDEHRHILVQRAYDALSHLEKIERDLPPIEMPELERLSVIANLDGARFGTIFLPVHGAVHVSWFERATRSAAVRTTFRALSPDDARNLLLHGYYIACCNLHVALGWPLLARLDASRLDALSAR